MSAAANRYQPRAPRYVFRPEDETLMCYKGMERTASRVHAEMQDLSASGLLIAVESDDVPWVGDMLKIEFGVPGRRQIAWFATVARVENRQEWEPETGHREATFVGLKFYRLPEPFQILIQTSLKGRKPKPEEKPIDLNQASTKEKAMLTVLSLALLGLFVLMSVPPFYWFR